MGLPSQVGIGYRLLRWHTNCVYCGVKFDTRPVAKGGSHRSSRRTWDHIPPKSKGGMYQVPCCRYCNGRKGDMALAAWYASEALTQRISYVKQDDPSWAKPFTKEQLVELIPSYWHRQILEG